MFRERQEELSAQQVLVLELGHRMHGPHPPDGRAGDAGHELGIGIAVQCHERARREHAHDGLTGDVAEAGVRAGQIEQTSAALRVGCAGPSSRC